MSTCNGNMKIQDVNKTILTMSNFATYHYRSKRACILEKKHSWFKKNSIKQEILFLLAKSHLILQQQFGWDLVGLWILLYSILLNSYNYQLLHGTIASKASVFSFQKY